MYIAASEPIRAGKLVVETRFLFLLTFAICVVLPHSLQTPTAGLLALTASTSLFVMRGGRRLTYVGFCYLASVAVTCFYLAVGVSNGAPLEAVLQTIAVYIISPLLWIIILRTALQQLGVEAIIRYLLFLSVLCCVSVALFFYLYFTFGPSSVSFFVENANINVGQGFSGAVMLVYGSLIFLTAGAFAAPELIRSKAWRLVLLVALAVCALTSGRAALILALPIGFLGRFLIRRENNPVTSARRTRRSGGGFAVLLFALLGLAMLDAAVEDVDLTVIAETAWEKIAGGGGVERVEQAGALWAGIKDTYGLGAGHGIGVGIERNALYPWRYENVAMATLFRVGLIGAAIYLLVFAICLISATRGILERRMRPHDAFIFSGFVAALLAAVTNPYIESFIFQWMYILPLLVLHGELANSADHSESDPAQVAFPTANN